MKHLQTCALSLCILLLSLTVSAQRMKLLEGDLSSVKSEKTINTEFTYDNMKVGKFDKEEDYVKTKTADYNKKEAGKGDSWAKKWVDDRQERFEPHFNDAFEKTSQMTVTPKAKYTLIYKTTFTEPGAATVVYNKAAQISGEAWIVETENKSKVIAKISVEKAPGRTWGGFDFETGERIGEAYEMSGKALARFILK